ncbi:MAG: hypothetical protein NVSMB3_04150 [Acidobacteriaceae bacterium]
MEVHAPHHPVHSWRDVLIHLAIVTVGLLIALGLEATVEWNHHRRQVAEAREALRQERDDTRESFAHNTLYLNREIAAMENNLEIFHFLQQHPGASRLQLPGVPVWSHMNEVAGEAAWQTAQQTAVTAHMPEVEVRRTAELYTFLNAMNKADAEVWQAINEAQRYSFADSDPSHLTAAEVGVEIELTKTVLMKEFNRAVYMRNLALEFPEFAPGPTNELLRHLLHLPEGEEKRRLEPLTSLTKERLDRVAKLPESAASDKR